MKLNRMNKIIEGNLLDIKEGVIVQQVNCKGVMGSGLAKQIRDKYPKVYNSFMMYANEGDKMLGSSLNVFIDDERLLVCNLYAQNGYGRDKQYTDCEAFRDALESMKMYIENETDFEENEIYFPYLIGCGLGGGEWDIISTMINKYFPDAIIIKLKEKE